MEVDRSKLRDMVAGFHTNTDAEKAAFIDGWNMADRNPAWRDVRIKMPEEAGYVLTFNADGDFIVGYYIADKKIWMVANRNEVIPNVKLWMPLPEIPIPSTAG
jgi:hypothetical protein